MGGSTLYDILTDNPGGVFPSEEWITEKQMNKYLWNYKLRVVTPEGKITKIGSEDGYRNVIVGKKTYATPICYTKIGCKYYDDTSNKGLVIHDIVYKYLKEHKLYSKLKSVNIHDELINFFKNPKRDTELMGKYLNYQDIFVKSKNYKPEILSQKEFNMSMKIRGVSLKKMKESGWIKINKNKWKYLDEDLIIENNNDYMLVDPEINIKNKKRIQKLVNLFIKSAIKSSNSNVKTKKKSKGKKSKVNK